MDILDSNDVYEIYRAWLDGKLPLDTKLSLYPRAVHIPVSIPTTHRLLVRCYEKEPTQSIARFLMILETVER